MTGGRHPCTFWKANVLLAIAALVGFSLLDTTASAQIVEDHLLHATSGTAEHLFPLNPAQHGFQPLQGGALMLRRTRSTELDQTDSGDDTLSSEVKEDHLAVGTATDLGAGAGLALSHQLMFRQTESKTSLASNNVREEFTKQTQTSAKLFIELTEQVKAGMAIRYLYQDATLIGHYFTGARTPIKTTLVGYGSGLALNLGNGGVNYAYYPPLRGKAEILGEEKIIVETGEIVADGFYRVNGQATLGLLGKTWLHELDDRAEGTTADDEDQTSISLYGLDIDQYVFPERLILVGLDYQASSQTALRLSVGQETATFNFRDMARFNRLAVSQPQRENPQMKTSVMRAMIRFKNQKLTANVGLNYYARSYDLPESMNDASYSSTGRDLFLMVGASL